MTKAELIEAVKKSTGKYDVSKVATEAIVDATFDQIAKTIKQKKRFQMPGFGTFTVRQRKARMGRNPQTGEAIKIKASKAVGFKAAPKLKKAL